MIDLPREKEEASRVNPSSMVIFSQPKMGKTTVLSKLDNCLLIDVEKGSHFVEALKYDVITKAEEVGELPIVILKQLINKIKEENTAKSGYVYKYIALDTVTALEEVVLPLANKMYRDTPMGRNWVGTDVTTLPNGAGYRYTRLALSTVLNELESICDTLIILGHVKDKLVEKDGKEMNERGLDLTGKSSSILCSQVDAVGYLYRNDDETVINFASSENLLSGARCDHLKGKEIVVAKSNETGAIKVDWSQIFIK
tara:strand:- start:56214 stop:56978 length:765 start_codon:yes stop_codon:yes gene_type:complete